MLSNIQIEEFMKKGLINITPYNPNNLDVNRYRLYVDSIRINKTDDDGVLQIFKYDFSKGPYAIAPGEYVIVSIAEEIKLEKGFFGEFYPASLNIENGLILNCGQLQSFYNRPILFGLLNVSPIEFRLEKGYEIARLVFEYLGENTPIDYDRKQTDPEYDEKIKVFRKTEEELNELKKQIIEKEKVFESLKSRLPNESL
jgi:deoxycytidine triphosphate deaminase